MKVENSKLMLFSNLMLEDRQHLPKYKYMPGDFVQIVFPEFRDKRTWNELSSRQIAELMQYVVCARCNRACAGTCEAARVRTADVENG
jgi:hypothetical protein